jgi:hypothetical protein
MSDEEIDQILDRQISINRRQEIYDNISSKIKAFFMFIYLLVYSIFFNLENNENRRPNTSNSINPTPRDRINRPRNSRYRSVGGG